MQIITTKYLGPTDTKGSRIKASGGGKSVTIYYDYGVTDEELHASAVAALNKKLNWSGDLIAGHTDTGMVWVFDTGYTIKISGELSQ
jgi:hypothetical protein